MASAQPLQKFDPTNHPGNVYDAFCEYTDVYRYVYQAIARAPPAGTAAENVPAWKEQDMRIQFLGQFAARSLQLDFEDELEEEERDTITYKDMLAKLKARYKPSQNKTLANFEFHKLRQESMETFDTWVN